MSFLDDVKKEIDSAKQTTENGAVGYSTSGKELLDMNFAIPKYRSANVDKIRNDFNKAYFENPTLAIAWVFYVRDVRGGLGERRLFRICMRELADINEEMFIELLPLVSEYGRWDDIFEWVGINEDINFAIANIVKKQFYKDFFDMQENFPISLLAKWLPTENCSNYIRKAKAKWVMSVLELSPKAYRKAVSSLRKYLDVVEVKTSNNDWSEIDYNTVPSNANLKYADAFMRHDEERRTKYLEDLKSGVKDVKINSSVLYPHDVVARYMNDGWYTSGVKSYDETLEQLWRALPNLVKEDTNTLVVADGSGSMTCKIGNSNVSALSVANALAIYFAERNKGEFANKYITFSNRPQLVDLSNATTLRDKLKIALSHSEVANTNIERVFKLILDTSIANNYTQSDMPNNIVIISDMEFDCMTAGDTSKAMFDNFADKYAEHGYKLPRLVFWNVNSRTNTIPIQQNESGVALISGFSVNLVNMVLSSETDPYKALVHELIRERCYPVLEIALEKK
jgi:hypothetical protein